MGACLTIYAFFDKVKDLPSIASRFLIGTVLRIDGIRRYYGAKLIREYDGQAYVKDCQRLEDGHNSFGNNLLITVVPRGGDDSNPTFAIVATQDNWTKPRIIQRLESCSAWLWKPVVNKDVILFECPSQDHAYVQLYQLLNGALRPLEQVEVQLSDHYRFAWTEEGAVISSGIRFFKLSRATDSSLTAPEELTIENFRGRDNVAIIELSGDLNKKSLSVNGSAHSSESHGHEANVVLKPLATVVFGTACHPEEGFAHSLSIPGTWVPLFDSGKPVRGSCWYEDDDGYGQTINVVFQRNNG